MVNELHNLLETANIKPPYVFVGHSLGGFIGRYFTSKYPDLVKGMLLLDPGPESHWNSMSKRELNKYIKGGTKWYKEKFEPKYRKEWYQLIPNLKYMEGLNIPKKLPIILVAASESNWYQHHSNLIKGLENSQHIELEGTHYIHREHPDKTVNYIKELKANVK